MATDTVVKINHLEDLYCNSTGALSPPCLRLPGRKSLSCICDIGGSKAENFHDDKKDAGFAKPKSELASVLASELQ
jgi:hypothetical protein